MLLISRHSTFGSLDVVWAMAYTELREAPVFDEARGGLCLDYAVKHKKWLGLSSTNGRVVHFDNKGTAVVRSLSDLCATCSGCAT